MERTNCLNLNLKGINEQNVGNQGEGRPKGLNLNLKGWK